MKGPIASPKAKVVFVSLLFVPVEAFLMLHLNRRIRGLSDRVLDRALGFHHVEHEVYMSLVTRQAYPMEAYERERFRQATGQLTRSVLLAARD